MLDFESPAGCDIIRTLFDLSMVVSSSVDTSSAFLLKKHRYSLNHHKTDVFLPIQ